MPYSLRRTRDGAGDSGQMSDAITPIWDDGQNYVIDKIIEHNARPKVGAAMMVGSITARSYSSQDWWMTTPITEILEARTEEDGTEYVRFKTGNSEYEWTQF
jgi:hypothetical protein